MKKTLSSNQPFTPGNHTDLRSRLSLSEARSLAAKIKTGAEIEPDKLALLMELARQYSEYRELLENKE